MTNLNIRIEEVLQNRIVDVTDDYKGKTKKGGYSVYLGCPQDMIDELVKLSKTNILEQLAKDQIKRDGQK